jgi:transposase
MHNAEKRSMAYLLWKQGVAKKEIARLLELDPKTVRRFIKDEGKVPPNRPRATKVVIDEARLRELYSQCDGWMQRVYEKLTEEEGLSLGYSTLTRRCHELGLADNGKNDRCEDGELLVKPGKEMQHDTSPFWILLGGKQRHVIASGLYYRYAKIRYVKFYLSFDRFQMKCFFFEGLSHFGFSAHECWIDNTNLARLSGTGKDAIMVPEMAAFGKCFGFEFHCHAIGHANRKAGKERNFFTLETNFFPGRTFKGLEDLNAQAKVWATERYYRRPHSKTGIIPAEAFEAEKPYLTKLPETILPPYREHERPTDRKGYVSLRANFYWVPGTKAHEQMHLIETPSRLKIYRRHECVADYPLVPADKRCEKRRPEGMLVPERPQHDHQNSDDEEKRLRSIGPVVGQYLDWLKNSPGRVRYRHRFMRELYGTSQRMTPSLFSDAIEQAMHHGIAEIEAIERIAGLILRTQGSSDMPWEDQLPGEEYLNRKSYEEGRFSDEPTLSMYATLFETPGKKDDGNT